MKQKYIKIKDKWYSNFDTKTPNHEFKYFTDNEAMLLNLSEETKVTLLERNNRKNQPTLIIIDGTDGVGKTTIVSKIIKKIEAQGIEIKFNTFKRRRDDNKLYKTPTIQNEWKFRREVVEQINKRLITYGNEDIIIVDKSPYCEYFYQRTKCFDRKLIMPYGNYKMEQEIFKYKDIIDNAIIIFLENEMCWKNYIERELKKEYKSSYESLKENEYMEMVESFKENQIIYEEKKKYKALKIQNDNKSWKVVYNEILKINKNGQ